MHDRSMRTTIEIADDKLMKLKKLAAERGERGFSALVDEALERYLETDPDAERARRERQAEAIRALAGSIDDETADQLRQSVRESKASWERAF